jgi:hypothetical protein
VLVYMLSGLSINAGTIFYIFAFRDMWMHEMNLGLYKAWEKFVALSFIHIFFFALIQSLVEFFVVWSVAGYREGVGYWIFGWFNFWQVRAPAPLHIQHRASHNAPSSGLRTSLRASPLLSAGCSDEKVANRSVS